MTMLFPRSSAMRFNKIMPAFLQVDRGFASKKVWFDPSPLVALGAPRGQPLNKKEELEKN
jgi:hypothetical protein